MTDPQFIDYAWKMIEVLKPHQQRFVILEPPSSRLSLTLSALSLDFAMMDIPGNNRTRRAEFEYYKGEWNLYRIDCM